MEHLDPESLLGDPERLNFADGAALLPAAASAGAQIRALAAADLINDQFRDFTPRALVVVATGRAAVDARTAIALIGPRAAAPIVVGATLPAWVGALDAILVLASEPDGGRPELVEAIEIARRRGATVLARGARFGPVAFAAGPDLLVPAVGVPEVLAGISRVLLVLQVAVACRLTSVRPDLQALAELADAESLACSPADETFVNPAKAVALHLTTGTGLLIGTEPVTTALAEHAAATIAELSDRSVVGTGPAALLEATGQLARLQTRSDIFADPFDDEDPATPLAGVLLQLTDQHPRADPQLTAAARRFAGVLTSVGVGGDGGSADDLAAAVTLSVRLDFAAVYLGLVTGQVVPPDAPAGLAPTGGAAYRLSPQASGGGRREDDDPWS